MIILVDTREQKPLKFKEEKGLEVKQKALAVGDYSCLLDDGTECPIRFERKNIGDLFGTMAGQVKVKENGKVVKKLSNYDRFKREMKRAEQMEIGLVIIVEGSFTDVAKGYKYSKYPGRAMIRKLFTLHLRYPKIIVYPVIFCNSPSEAAAFIKSYYEGFNKNLEYQENSDGDRDPQ